MRLLHASLRAAAVFSLAAVLQSQAAIVGTNGLAEGVTFERIGRLPAVGQQMWRDYLERSGRQSRADFRVLQDEMGKAGLKESILSPSGSGADSLPLDRARDWYGGEEARRLAAIVISFQTPSGGWSKNLDLTKHVRQPGEGFATGNRSRYLGPGDNDTVGEDRSSYVGTIDNGATTTELRFLARMILALPESAGAEHRQAFERGVGYLLEAQNPNGGWPQVWPLQGGYHDAITYNDGAMVHVMELLQEIADGTGDFGFVTKDRRERVRTAVRRGLDCILATQVIVGGRRTVWCQQHDALTLAPSPARNYEMPSLSSAESAGIVGFLMRLPAPDSNAVAAVRAAVSWLETAQIRDVAFRTVGDEGRLLVSEPGGGPLWARFYEIGTDRPIFGDRDKTIHDRVEGISRERRDGYAWFIGNPRDVLRRYATWNEGR